MKSMMKKTTLREIRSSLGRYLAILSIVALGVGFFSGLRVTQTAMVKTADSYLSQHAFYDYRLISPLGFTEDDVDALAQTQGVSAAQGAVYKDFLNEDGGVVRAHSITGQVNTLQIEGGRLPQTANECVVDAYLYKSDDIIGTTVRLSQENDSDTLDGFACKEYTVVGRVRTPLYLNYERGTTTIGDGSVDTFIFLLPEGFVSEYYTEIYLTLTETGYLYSDEYDLAVQQAKDSITDAANARVQLRYDDIVSEYQQKIDDAQQQLDQGRADYEAAKAESEQKLADAKALLDDTQAQLDASLQLLQYNQAQLDTNQKQLDEGRAQLAAKQQQLNDTAAQTQAQLDQNESDLNALLLQAQQQLDAAVTPEEKAAAAAQLQAVQAQVSQGLQQVQQGRQQAQTQLAAGQAQIDAAAKELDDTQAKLDAGREEVNNGFWQADEAFAQLEQGRTEYETNKASAQQQLQDALQQLQDGETKLAQSRDDMNRFIADLGTPESYVLDRTANVGYECFKNDSQIVHGISNVFPIFFFLVAALVCVTTMTRMIDEQRTQIGTLKALGYSQFSILMNYVSYSGSAAITGCLLGFYFGSFLFPRVIWTAYGIMYGFAPILYVLDYSLGGISLAGALLCSVGATVAACKADLLIAPAQLMRPKSPKAGKRVLLERIGFIWKRLSFLHKVSMRNIFRYRQRFIMMVLGIGGCTALLLTGFGISDSIQNIVNYQYDEITLYDYSITFTQDMPQSARNTFLKQMGKDVENVEFLYQTTVDLNRGGVLKSPILLAFDSGDTAAFTQLFDLHSGEDSVALPQQDEAIISRGLAKTFSLQVGDSITVTNAELEPLELKIAGIFDNYVYNYVLVQQATCTQQWGHELKIQTAYASAAPDADVYHVGSAISGQEHVGAVTISQDFRLRFENMLSSLNYIVIFVIFCAGALAFIVLYNLTNINITERIREIATIKVLGFYPAECAQYVFRENLILTFIGGLAGLAMGVGLHAFVMAQIQIDLVYFENRILPQSYLYALALTFAFALFVNFVLRGKLRRINMAESLKSIE